MRGVKVNRFGPIFAILFFSVVLCMVPRASGTPFFKPIGFLPTGDFSRVGGISPDGNVVVGESNMTAIGAGVVNRAIRWENGTMKSLGFLTFNPIESTGFDASFDGSVIVGREKLAVGLGSAPVAWRWEAGIMTQLPFLPLGDSNIANAVSYDGRTIVGGSNLGTMFFNSTRWVNGVVQNAGTATGDDDDLSGMSGISGDGLVTTGSSTFPGDTFHAFRNDGLFTDLGTLENIFVSNGKDISGNGEVVVGVSDIINGVVEAFRWENGQMVGLGDLPGGNLDSEALATDEDGDVIVGRGHTDAGDEAFRWTPLDGMVNLKDALEGAGLDLTGWTLTDAVAVSANGLVIAGNGINPDGFNEGWVASIPEPSTLALAAGLIGIGLAQRRRRMGW